MAERADDDGAGFSLQQRLRVQLLGAVALAWLAASLLAGWAVWRGAADVMDDGLAETAEHLMLLPEAVLRAHDEAERTLQRGPHAAWLVYQLGDAAGHLLLRSHLAPDTPLAPGAADGVADHGPWRVLTLSSADGSRRAQVAEPLSHRRAVLWRSLAWLGAVLLGLLPLLAWLVTWQLRRGFAPLEHTRTLLTARHPGALDPVPALGLPLELRPWLQAVNALLERVQAGVEAERAFAAHSAHELRTPLAAARAQAQRLLAELAPTAEDGADPHAAARAQAQALVRQLDRLARLSVRLLQLARVDAGLALHHQPVQLDQLAQLVADDFAEARRSGRLQLQLADDVPPVSGDLDALGIALRNLIDNALQHGGDTVQVRVSLQHLPGGQADGDPAAVAGLPAGPAVRLSVCDDGPGVPASEVPRLLQRFERGRGLRPPGGTGLGLWLVAAIAQQSGARLALQAPPDGQRGLCASLTFQVSGQPPQAGGPGHP